MKPAMLEHANITVIDAEKTAQELKDLFGWRTRWEGPSQDGLGYSIHVGTDNHYLAIYSPTDSGSAIEHNPARPRALNHIGVVVDDLDQVEKIVRGAGFAPHHHADYEPGRRFYFFNSDGIELEVVSYR